METTKDAFLDGAVTVFQPARGGHRAGMDALLLAASVPENLQGRVADFGAGCGVAGMAVAYRCPGTIVDLVERDDAMVEVATKSIALPENACLRDRLDIICADLTASHSDRVANGLQDNRYEAIIANPPFNDENHRKSPDVRRRAAHHLEDGDLDKWVKTASTSLKGRGVLTMIVRPTTFPRLLDALKPGFGSVIILPIHPKSTEPANRLIIQAKRGGRGEPKFLPSFVVHKDDGNFTEQAEAVFRGRREVCLV